MLPVTHQLYAIKDWVTVVNTSHGKYCLPCMLCVHTDRYTCPNTQCPCKDGQKDVPCQCGNMQRDRHATCTIWLDSKLRHKRNILLVLQECEELQVGSVLYTH